MVGLTFAESLEENGLVHFPKTPLEVCGSKKSQMCHSKKKSQLCHKHNCENNSCVVSMVCESMIHPLRLARGNLPVVGESSGNCVLFKGLEPVPDFSTWAFQTNGGTSPRCLLRCFAPCWKRKINSKIFHIHIARSL